MQFQKEGERLVLHYLFSSLNITPERLQDPDFRGEGFGFLRKAVPVLGFLGKMLLEFSVLFPVLTNRAIRLPCIREVPGALLKKLDIKQRFAFRRSFKI